MSMLERAGSAERAAAVLAGGCDSPVRSGWAVGGEPFIQTGARGAYAYDERGERYIDYIMAYGPLLFGHTHPALVTNLDQLAANGAVWGSTHPEEIHLAERIRSYLPVMERMRFVTTGTEAVMSAIRVARAYTGRNLVLKFAGNYHGHFDLALLDAGASAHTNDAARGGISAGVMRDVTVARYNDLESVDRVLANIDSGGPSPFDFVREAHYAQDDITALRYARDDKAEFAAKAEELAAILVEPIVGNMGFVQPEPGFLEGLRERATRYGAVLIFDEVITWLRFGLGGATAWLKERKSATGSQGAGIDVRPDMVTVGKIMGGGFPIAAFGGREEIMNVLAPVGSTFTGGTHGGNPFGVGMAHRVLDVLEAHPEYYPEMNLLAKRLADGIRAVFKERNLPYAVVQQESIVDFKFRPGPPNRNYDDARAADKAAYAHYYHAMRERKILLPPSQNEVMFVSAAHTETDIDETLHAIDQSLHMSY